MPVTVNIDGLRVRMLAAQQPIRKSAVEMVDKMDRIIGQLATMDMIAGETKGRGRGLRTVGRNTTAFLRIATGNLFRSYTEPGNPFHVRRVTWDGWRLNLESGSRQTSAKGFPYAWYHEAIGPAGRARPHLKRAYIEFKRRLPRFARDLAFELALAWNKTK